MADSGGGKAQLARQLGADEAIDSTATDRVRRVTAMGGGGTLVLLAIDGTPLALSSGRNRLQHTFGLEIPETLAEIAAPERSAVLVYDMQAGIVPFVQDATGVTRAVAAVLTAARACQVRVFYTRHMSLPAASSGVTQTRFALRLQRVRSVQELQPRLLQGSPEYQIVPEVAPGPEDVVFDKLQMSALHGSPLAFALNDLRLTTLIITGCVAEIGIDPTVRHAADLGFLPVVVSDACGALSPEGHQRTMSSLRGVADIVEAAQLRALWEAA